MRLIFGWFLEGLTTYAIAKELTRCGIITVTGRAKWNAATINGVLANEKYTGCARIQKTFTPDFLTKKVVKNTGQVPSYFVEQSHPAIIAPKLSRWCRQRCGAAQARGRQIQRREHFLRQN